MIYLKYFEDCIKHSDPIAVNHKLRDFSRRLEDIIILLQELNKFDLKNATVKRYFHENKAISIAYEDSMLGKLFKISSALCSLTPLLNPTTTTPFVYIPYPFDVPPTKYPPYPEPLPYPSTPWPLLLPPRPITPSPPEPPSPRRRCTRRTGALAQTLR